jgi:hypothetical protein
MAIQVMEPHLYHEEKDGVHLYRYYQTDNCWSGGSDTWSDWFLLSNGPLPDGYRVVTATFVLNGDRVISGNEQNTNPQGAWCEAKQVLLSARKVTWQFRMQGHSENALNPFQNPMGISIGHLLVHFLPTSILPITD